MKTKRQFQITAIEENFKDELKRLRDFTVHCRPDMHEPDEQGITAEFGPTVVVREVGGKKYQTYVIHPQLDNACSGEGQDMGFWLVKDEGTTGPIREWFNLANIIALARR